MQVLSSAPMEMTKTVNVHAYMQVKKIKNSYVRCAQIKVLGSCLINLHLYAYKGQWCKELPNGICPPDQLRLGTLCTTSGNTGPSTRQTPGAWPSTCRSTDYAPPLWCGHLKSHLYPSGIGQRQWSCPSPAYARSSIYYFTWAWAGGQVEKE